MNSKINLFALTQSSLREFFAAMEEKPFRATQVMKWIYHHGVVDVTEMNNLAKDLRGQLMERVYYQLPQIVSDQESSDGTRKWLMQIDNQNSIETVFIPEPDRGTLCISSQAGCPLACSFCSTGKQGFGKNLDVADIIGQLWLANNQLGHFVEHRRVITNVVLMGMGEPLLNFSNVVSAIDLMLDDFGFNLARKRVTLSTAGVVPGIDRLAAIHKVCLAVSLHAPHDDLRDELVPLNKTYPIKALMAACRRYAAATDDNPITFEYVMLQGINDSPAEARQLVRILQGIPSKINLIPFNPFPGSSYTRSSKQTIDVFRDILMKSGLVTITRKTRGEDINAACGQLVGQIRPRKQKLQDNLTA